MSQTKVKSGLLNFPDQTDFVKLPSGTTAQRPPSPEKGYSRYNTTDNKLEYWNGTIWQQLPGITPPIITSISYPGDDLAADPDGGQTITINGSNFITGATVTVDDTTPSVITFVSANQITFTAPAKTAGDYDIVVTNVDGGNATAVDGMTYNGLPSWTTPAGNLGTFEENTTIPTITLVAAEPDSGAISYSITTGGLPTGLSLVGADIDGTTPAVAGETTYNFTVTATDNENQSTERAFNIVVYIPIPLAFNTVLWTGTGSNQSITGVGFDPEFIITKNRDLTVGANVFDVIRDNFTLYLAGTAAQADFSAGIDISSANTDGFDIIGESSSFNSSGRRYVAWCWKAGGAAVTNTDGTITSQVSANVDAGFSIVKYTASGGGNYSVGHGLSQTPDFVIVKPTTENVGWTIWSSTFPNLTNSYINFTTAAVNTAGTVWGSGMTSTVIGQTSGATSNPNQSLIAYVFHSVPKFSKFGSYTGTGASGNTVDVGFEPAFVMIKRTEDLGEWIIFDNKRETTSIKQDTLAADSNRAESTNVNYEVEFQSNGFSVNGTSAGVNASPETYIYMTFANQF